MVQSVLFKEEAMRKLVIIFLIFFLSQHVMALTKKYQVDFGKGGIFKFQLQNKTIQWEGVTGDDKGIMETNKMNRMALSPQVEVIQYTTNKGYFMTTVFDHKNGKIVNSKRAPSGEMSIAAGKVKELD